MLLTEFPRRNADVFAERRGKIARIVIPDGSGNFVDRKLCGKQKVFGNKKFFLLQISKRTDSLVFLKELAEMLGTDVALCGNVFDGQLPVNVDINKFLGAFRQ